MTEPPPPAAGFGGPGTSDADTRLPRRSSESVGGRLKRLGSESLVYGLSSIVGRLLSYLLQPYYAHQFNPAQNGIQSVVYSYIPIVSIALYLGMDVAYMRHVALVDDADRAERERVFTMSFGIVAVVGGAMAALGFAATPVLAPLARLDAGSFRYLMAIVYSDALLAVPFAHLRMTHRSLRYAVYRVLFVAISVALNIVLIGQLHWGVSAIFFANLAANLAILVLFAPEIARLVRPSRLAGAEWSPLWSYALPVMPATLAVMLVENGDRITLNYLPERVAAAVYHMTAKDVVGIYSFNYKLGVAMLLVVQMFRMAWVPFSLQHARQPGAPALYSRVLTALMLICVAAFLVISVLLPVVAALPPVQHYVKPEYWIGLPIVPVILLGYVFSGIYAVVTAGLYIERRTQVLAWIAGAGAVLNVGICVVAAPRWGMVSVAWATPASYALMAALGAWQANRFYPVPFEWLRLAHLAAIGAALFAADRWIASAGVAPLSAAGAAAKAGVLAALPLLLLASGFFRHGEMRALRAMVSRSSSAAG